MAVPNTITSAAGVLGFHPPELAANGYTYVVAKSGNSIQILRSADPVEAVWSVMATLPIPANVNYEDVAVAVAREGETLYLAYYDQYLTSPARLRLRATSYSMSSDTVLQDKVVKTQLDEAGVLPIVIAAAGGKVQIIDACEYDDSWNITITETTLDAATLNVVYGPTLTLLIGYEQIPGALIANPAGTKIISLILERVSASGTFSYARSAYAQTFNPADGSFEAEAGTANWPVNSGAGMCLTNAVFIPSDPLNANTDTILSVAAFTGNDAHATIVTSLDANGLVTNTAIDAAGAVTSAQRQYFNLNAAHITLAAGADKAVYIVYVGGGTSGGNRDLYLRTRTGKHTFGAPTLLLAATAAWVSAKVMYRGAAEVLGILYGDAGVTKYHEVLLSGSYTSPESQITGTGIPSSEISPSPRLGINAKPVAIGSSEAMGAVKLNLTVPGVVGFSAGAQGTPTIQAIARATAIAITSAEALGSPRVGIGIRFPGLVSQEAFGSQAINLVLPGVSAGESTVFGGTQLVAQYTLPLTGIASAEQVNGFGTNWSLPLSAGDLSGAIGQATLTTAYQVLAVGIPSQEVVNTIGFTTQVRPVGIVAGSMGFPVVGSFLRPGTIAGGAVGTPLLAYSQLVSVPALGSEEAFGMLLTQMHLFASGLASAEVVGIPSASLPSYQIRPQGFADADGYGSPQLNQVVYLQAMNNGEAFGAMAAKAKSSLSLTGIPGPVFGTAPSVGLLLRPIGIPSGEAVRAPSEILFSLGMQGIGPGGFGTAYIRNKIGSRPILTIGVIL